MTNQRRALAWMCVLLTSAVVTPGKAQDSRQSSHQIGVRVSSTELRDAIKPGGGAVSPKAGSWLVVKTASGRETGNLEIQLTEASNERRIRPSFSVVELDGPPGEFWQDYDTTLTTFARWLPAPAQTYRIQFIFDVAGSRQPYRFQAGPLCFAVASSTPATPAGPCVSARIASAVTRDSATIRNSVRSNTLSGPFLLVWVDFAVIGDREVEAVAVSLVSAASSFDEPLSALVVDSTMKSVGPFISVGSEPHFESAQGGVAVRFHAVNVGGSELTLRGRQTIGLLFSIRNLQPPYGLQFADSTRTIPLSQVPRKGAK